MSPPHLAFLSSHCSARPQRLAQLHMLRPYIIDSLKAVCQVSLPAHIKLIKLMVAAAGTHQMPLKYNSFMNNSKH